jgi:hypothetical protein
MILKKVALPLGVVGKSYWEAMILGITNGVVHANVGQKLLFCDKSKRKVRVFLVTDNKFWTQDVRSQTMTNAIVKPLDRMLFLLLTPSPNKLYTHVN